MRRLVVPSGDLPALRLAVWLAFAAMILLFWGFVAALVVSFFR